MDPTNERAGVERRGRALAGFSQVLGQDRGRERHERNHQKQEAVREENARDLGWMLVLNQMVVDPIIQGDLKPGSFPSAPETLREMVDALERAHHEAMAKIERLTDEDLNGTLQMPVGHKRIGDVRRGSALWMMLHDTIHHRGQFSVYLRIAGAKVPSIYGPSADEPWF